MLRVCSLMLMMVGAIALVGCNVIPVDPCADVTCDAGETCVEGVCVADDLCADVTCDAGETCVDGVCVADDPCADVTCDAGETCVDGVCVADDPCADVTCDAGETCVDGVCVADDPCADVTCDAGETCVDGVCVADGNGGDAAAGETFYAACAGCHAADASGGFGPNIQGDTAAELQAGVEAAPAFHGTFTITAEDYANLEAFLAGF